jgi:acyl-CoA thioesterase FadM
MPRISIEPPGSFTFSCHIPVRITDINYGGHAGNDSVLSLLHEIRMQFLGHYGYTEMQFAGVGMIMTAVSIEFKSELFYGETVIASAVAGEFSKVGFVVFYKLEKAGPQPGSNILVALAKTEMLCYDYTRKKIVSVPEEARERFKI